MGTVLTPGPSGGLMADAACLRLGTAYRTLIGVGGIGSGVFLRLQGDHTLGRSESRPACLVDGRDYCKLHIICHLTAALLGSPFHVRPVGRIGDDETGCRLKREMAAAGLDVSHVHTTAGRPTLFSVCFQYRDGSGGNITAANSAAAELDEADVGGCEPILAFEGPRTVVLAVPEVPLASRDRLLQLGTRYGALRVASFASAEIAAARSLGMLSRIDLLALNEDEVATLAGRDFDPSSPGPFLTHCAAALLEHQPGMRIVVTAGKRGAFAWNGDGWDFCPAPAVAAVSTAGAGDALLAGIVSGLVAGMPLARPAGYTGRRSVGTALELGVLLAAFSVTSPHTIHPGANIGALLAFAEQLQLNTSELLPYLSLAGAGAGAAAAADASTKMDSLS